MFLGGQNSVNYFNVLGGIKIDYNIKGNVFALNLSNTFFIWKRFSQKRVINFKTPPKPYNRNYFTLSVQSHLNQPACLCFAVLGKSWFHSVMPRPLHNKNNFPISIFRWEKFPHLLWLLQIEFTHKWTLYFSLCLNALLLK